MLRTFSKIYALGGLRLGWAYCSARDRRRAEPRARRRSTSAAAAQAAASPRSRTWPRVDRARAHNDIWRPWLTRELDSAGPRRSTPSVGEFRAGAFPGRRAENADAAFAFCSRAAS